MKHLLLFILSILAISSHSQNLISNGNFSGGWSNWTTNSDAQIWDNASFANSPTKYAPNPCDASGNRINNGNGELWQTVSFPNNTSTGTISFYSYISTEETTTTTGYDFLKVYIGSVLIATYSNLHSNSGYQSFSLNIPTSVINFYKGNSTDLSFKTTTDGAKRTIFRIDDVALNITTSSCTAVGLSVYPQDQSTSVGGSATFSLTTSGTAPFTYQWYRNGNSISGATSSSYTLSNCQSSDNGASFYCVCTNCNGSNQIQSQTKYLTVNGGSSTGSVQVNLAPAEAVTAGATWSINGSGSYTSGQTISSISQGSHTIAFSTVAGWTSPQPQTINVSTGNTATTQGTYTKIQTSNIDLTIANLSTDISTIKQGSYFKTNVDLKNIGTGNAVGTSVTYWLSDNCSGNISNDILLGTSYNLNISANSTIPFAKSINIPPSNSSLGNKYIKCWINHENNVLETNTNNNLTCAQVNVITNPNLSGVEYSLNDTMAHLFWPFYNPNDNNALNTFSKWEGQTAGSTKTEWNFGNDHDMDNDGEDDHHLNAAWFSQDWRYIFGQTCGQSLYSPLVGTIIYIGDNCLNVNSSCRDPKCNYTGYGTGGNWIAIYSKPYLFRALHLNSINPNLKKGQNVSPGDFLGIIGNTGNSTNSHTHCQLYKNVDKSLIPNKNLYNDKLNAADFKFDATLPSGGDDSVEVLNLDYDLIESNYDNSIEEELSKILSYSIKEPNIYPNPFNDNLKIEMEYRIESIKVFDIMGKMVHSEIGQGNEQIINLSNLVEGVYFIDVISKNGESHKQKIIKSK